MTRIYLITPPRIDDVQGFAARLPAVLEAGAVPCLQLRLKEARDDDWREAIERIFPVCKARDTAFIVNDRVDLAKEFGCDGAHIGMSDMSYEEARRLLPDKIIGVSCHASKDAAMTAAAAGADYVAFGSVFPGGTKEEAPPCPLSVLEDWAAMATTPCAAIGGITAENCGALARAGVDFAAVIGAVWNHAEGPVTGITCLKKALFYSY